MHQRTAVYKFPSPTWLSQDTQIATIKYSIKRYCISSVVPSSVHLIVFNNSLQVMRCDQYRSPRGFEFWHYQITYFFGASQVASVGNVAKVKNVKS